MFPFFFGSIQSYSAKKNINIIIRKNYLIQVKYDRKSEKKWGKKM